MEFMEIMVIDNTEYLDEDGYPTEEALGKIETCDCTTNKDFVEFFGFLESLWYLKSWGWYSEEFNEGERKGLRYYLSSAGWSGNESLIKAFQRNEYLWCETWVCSRKGGHYEFEFYFEEE